MCACWRRPPIPPTPPPQESLTLARELYVKLRDGELLYERIRETALRESYGTSICGQEVLGEALKRTLKAAAPIHGRELQLSCASSHASGDHCVPIGQGFQIKGEPDLQAYIITSTNRCETLGAYIVPDASFDAIEPALVGLGGRSTFDAAAYTVDDAHQSRERTLLALNTKKLEGLAAKLELPAISELLP